MTDIEDEEEPQYSAWLTTGDQEIQIKPRPSLKMYEKPPKHSYLDSILLRKTKEQLEATRSPNPVQVEQHSVGNLQFAESVKSVPARQNTNSSTSSSQSSAVRDSKTWPEFKAKLLLSLYHQAEMNGEFACKSVKKVATWKRIANQINGKFSTLIPVTGKQCYDKMRAIRLNLTRTEDFCRAAGVSYSKDMELIYKEIHTLLMKSTQSIALTSTVRAAQQRLSGFNGERLGPNHHMPTLTIPSPLKPNEILSDTALPMFGGRTNGAMEAKPQVMPTPMDILYQKDAFDPRGHVVKNDEIDDSCAVSDDYEMNNQFEESTDFVVNGDDSQFESPQLNFSPQMDDNGFDRLIDYLKLMEEHKQQRHVTKMQQFIHLSNVISQLVNCLKNSH